MVGTFPNAVFVQVAEVEVGLTEDQVVQVQVEKRPDAFGFEEALVTLFGGSV